MAAARKRNAPAAPTASDKQNRSGSDTGSREKTTSAGSKQPVGRTPTDWRQWATPLLVFLTLGVAIGLVYGPGLRAPLIHDDGASILGNPSIVRLWPLVGAVGPLNPPKDLPTSGRPLVNLSLALNYRFGEYNPIGYHLFSLVAHALNATLVWALIRRALRLDYFRGAFDGQAGWLALAIALVWALHPLLTQCVEYITQRSELMLGFCYLATMYASLRYFTTTVASARIAWLAIATLACFAGMACKEVMASAPLMVALFDRTLIAGSWRRAVQRSWPLYLALAASWLLLLGLNIGGPRSASAGFQSDLSAPVWWLTQAEVVVKYVKLAFWPSPLLMHWDVPYLETIGAAWPWILPVAAMVVATLVLLYRKSALGLLGAWFFLILSPTLVVPIVTEVAAERRMYLSLIAIVTFVIVGSFKLVEWIARRVHPGETAESRGRWSAVMVMLGALSLSVICGIASSRRVKVYLDPVALWQSVLDVQPENIVALIGLSDELNHIGRADEAFDHVQKALAIAPESFVVHHAAGVMLLDRRQHAEAIAHLQKVVEIKPKSASAYNNLAVALNSAGQTREAIAIYEKVLELDPNYVEARNNLATALANQGDLDQALKHYALAVRLQPDLVAAHKSMGIILMNKGQSAEGIKHLEAAAKFQPDVDNYSQLAIACANSQRISQALSATEKALELARAAGQTELVNQLEALRANLKARQAK